MKKYLITLVFILIGLFLFGEVAKTADTQCCILKKSGTDEIIEKAYEGALVITEYKCKLITDSDKCERTNLRVGTAVESVETEGGGSNILGGVIMKADEKKVSCLSERSCWVNILDTTIIFGGDYEITTEIGQTRTIAVEATAANGKTIKDLRCTDCRAGITTQSVSELNKQVVTMRLTLDSAALYAAAPTTLPGRSAFNIYAIGNDDKVNMTSIPIVINPENCADYSTGQNFCSQHDKYCFWLILDGSQQCANRFDESLCSKITADTKGLCGSTQGLDSSTCKWQTETGGAGRCVSATAAALGAGHEKDDDYQGPLPDCVFNDTCNDVNDLLQLLVNCGKFSLTAVGAFAFVFFVYGGFTIITSFGNAERVKKGQQALVAAVVGIVICLVAYLAIDFMLNAIGVTSDFRAIK